MFFEPDCFLRPETRFPESTPDEDHNDISFDRIGKSSNYISNNFQRTEASENEPVTSSLSEYPEESPEVTIGRPLEDFEIRFKYNRPLQQEILLVGGIHYSPSPNPQSNPNIPSPPEWIIISADPHISALLPVTFNHNQGIILCRGQAIIHEGYLVIDLNRSPSLTSSAEIERGVFDLRTFVGPCRPREIPFRLFSNDPRIQNIFNVANSCLIEKAIQMNINVFNNTSNIWTFCIQNNINLGQIYNHNSIRKDVNLDLFKHSEQINLTKNNIVNNEMINISNNKFNQNASNPTTHTSKAIVQEHKVEPFKEVVKSEAHVVSHEVETHHETLTSNALILSHNVNPQHAQITSSPTVESLHIEPNNVEKTINTNVESLRIDPICQEKIATAKIESLLVKPNINEKTCTTNIDSLHVKPNVIDKTISTEIESLHIKSNVTEKTFTTKIDSLHVEPICQEKTINANIESLHVEPQCINKKASAIVESLSVEAINKVNTSNALVEHHKVNVNKKLVTTVAKIEENEIRFNLVKKIIIIDIPDFEIVYKHTFKGLHISNSSYSFSSSYDSEDECYSTSIGFNSSTSDLSSQNSNNNNSRDTLNTDNNEEEEESPTENISDDNLVDELTFDVKMCENKEDIINLIHKWRVRQNYNCWKHDNIALAKQPLVHIMIRENKWCFPGQFSCQCKCDEVFKSGNALLNHMNKMHGIKPDKNHLYGCIRELVGKDLIWLILNTTIAHDNDMFRDNVFVCPLPNCKYFTNIHKSLISHIIHKHPEFEESINTIGWFWATIITYTKTNDKIPSGLDILSPREGYICKYCKICWSSDPKGILNHAKKQHELTNIEGDQLVYNRIKCYSAICTDLQDRMERVNNDLNEYQDLIFAQRNITERERLNIRDTQIVLNQEQAVTIRERQSREERRRNIIERNLQIEEANQANSVQRTQTPINPDLIVSPIIHNFDPQSLANSFDINKLSKLNREQLLEVTRFWTDLNNEQESQFVSLPKIWGKNKRKIKAKISNLFKDKTSN